MASSRASPTPSTFVSGLHLLFTLTSVAFLSYKVYYLENELSLIRGVISSEEPSDVGITASQVTPLSTVPTKEQLISEWNRRAQSSSADKLKAKCTQNLLKDLQVCLIHFVALISLIINTELPTTPQEDRRYIIPRISGFLIQKQKKVQYLIWHWYGVNLDFVLPFCVWSYTRYQF